MMEIHADKLRWLVWLRWKMVLRGFSRNNAGRASNLIGTIILLFFVVVFGVGLGVASFFGYRFAPPPINAEILFLVLTGIYLFWIFSPLLQVATNEGLDVSKLMLFPLTRGELMASLLLSTLLDSWTIFIVCLLAAVVAGWATSVPMALIALLAALIFYVQVIGISQLVIALLSRVLHSRRLRDLSVILIVLLSASGYFWQFAFRGETGAGLFQMLQSGAFSSILQWLPPGMAARAIQQASVGNWGMSFVWLGGLLLLSLLVLYLWQTAMERALTAPESGGEAPRRRRRAEPAGTAAVSMPAAPVAPAGLLARLRSSQVFAIADKDLKYYWRDPQLKAMLLQSLLSLVFLLVITLLNTAGRSGSMFTPGPWIVMAAPGYVFFALYTLSYNVLGFERQSLTTLFLFPIEPKRVLWGKNLIVAVLGIVEIVLIVGVTAFMSQGWDYLLPALAVGLAGLGVVLGCGNFTSVFLPQRMKQMQRGFQTTQGTPEAGCMRALLSMLAFLVMLVILLPVAAAFVLPVLFHAQWIWTISIPASLLYGLIFYYVVTALVATRMINHIPEILEVVARE
ncbi:MAG: hypothetical protein IMW89_02160 [Ktedonobacteraceae bacterium]|nr:hypothetical protein [Ktedonobacteraceae bacterium]